MGITDQGLESLGLNTNRDEDQSEWIKRLAKAEATLADLPEAMSGSAGGTGFADVLLERGRSLVGLDRGSEAWASTKEALDIYLEAQDWEKSVDACDILFGAEQDEQSLAALGQGIWLAVTFPVDLELTLSMLHHIIDETPDNSDGAAVAAATGSYLVDLRGNDAQKENLGFFANQMLGKVARRHSEVESQQDFGAWVIRLELDDPEKFLIRLRNVIDVLVQDHWWFDRDALRSALPGA